jgi:predicted RND superfamily exporter protein
VSKRISIIIIVALFLFTGIAGFMSSKLEFDYDFEHFFPQNDTDLDYFLDYRKTFENDNDYVLISIGNIQGVFDTTFLQKAHQFTKELEQLIPIKFSLSSAKNREEALAQLNEECGEVVAAIGKTMRFGYYSVNPLLAVSEQEMNIDWVKRETQDLKLAIENFERFFET